MIARARHPVGWVAPAVLWSAPALEGTTSPGAPMLTPEILRFASDRFMDELLDLLEHAPEEVVSHRAQPETWEYPVGSARSARVPLGPRLPFRMTRREKAGAPRFLANKFGRSEGAPLSEPPTELKLYQPAHQRYYLVIASLVCRIAGLPDRRVELAQQQKVTFVLRLYDPSTRIEKALVASGSTRVWQSITLGLEKVAVEGEEQTELFPLAFRDSRGDARRMFGGLVPVGQRDALLAIPQVQSNAGAGGADGATTAPATESAHALFFRTKVAQPWRALLEQAHAARLAASGASTADTETFLYAARPALLTGSWFVLLALAEYLQRFLPGVWAALTEDGATVATPEQQALLAALDRVAFVIPFGTDWKPWYGPPSMLRVTSLRTALRRLVKQDNLDRLKRATVPFARENAAQWPDFVFPLADPDDTFEVVLPATGARWKASLPADPVDGVAVREAFEALVLAVDAAIGPAPAEPAPAPPAAAGAMVSPQQAAWFRIRCVFHRPNCQPWESALVSDPTREFQMAAFFDPDAPARPVRIGLPIDTTPEGLRRFDKNAVLVMSDVLCGQVKKFRSLSLGDLVLAAIPPPFGKPLDAKGITRCTDGAAAIGMACSISIPIVTICALILLMIMVNLLEIVFRWMPYFVCCFPIPKLGAKKP
jgi:hypothetical protein